MVLLSAAEVKSRLKELDGWSITGKSVWKKFKFKNFVQAVGFVNRIVPIAEGMQHHPDITIENYNEVIVRSTTHDEKGLTAWDFKLAHKIEELTK
jgi:4a-hydroxytetrahydrobiopterin dehydratase